MNKFFFGLLILLSILSLDIINVYSAPLPPGDKYDITGIISEINWYPKKLIKGAKGMSGSAGKDRMMPAHYIIKLVNYDGINNEDAARITRYIKSDAFKDSENKKVQFILLKINYENKYYLKKGMAIKVTGYKVRGDEGGTYTYYENIEILEFPNQDLK